MLAHPVGELGFHAAAGLGVDGDRLGLRIGLEERHELGVGRADDGVAADRDAVDWPSPAAVSVLQISVVMPPERDMTPIGPFLKALRTSTARPPRPPIFASSGDSTPRQFGPMMRAPRSFASSTICATSTRGMRSVTMTMSLTPASIASNTASRVNAGGTVTIEPSTCVFARDVAHAVVDRHAVDVAAAASRRDAADDLRAVVEALAGQVHGLAAGDALDDEGRVVGDEDRHRSGPLHLGDGAAGGLVHRDACGRSTRRRTCRAA